MSEKNPYRLFVAHAFRDHAEYLRVFEYLESRDNFFYINYSNPGALESNASPDLLQEEIRNQIRNVEAVIVPAGVLADKSGLVDFELNVAQAFDKPIVLIQSFGGTISLPMAVLELAAEVVEWNERSIIDAVKRAARGVETSQWDVIDFDPEEFKLQD